MIGDSYGRLINLYDLSKQNLQIAIDLYKIGSDLANKYQDKEKLLEIIKKYQQLKSVLF
jgi:hypothetical protein